MRLLLLTFVIACALPAAAQIPAPTGLELGGRAVYYVPSDGDGTWNPGVQGRWFFSPVIAGELSADYQRHDFADTTAHTGAFQASALAYLWRSASGNLSAFPLVGLGYYLARLNGPDYHRNLGRFAAHAGAGVEYQATPDWSLDITYRHVFLGDISSGARELKRSGEQLTFGINRRFGAGALPAARP